jgi:hypothetical protein
MQAFLSRADFSFLSLIPFEVGQVSTIILSEEELERIVAIPFEVGQVSTLTRITINLIGW